MHSYIKYCGTTVLTMTNHTQWHGDTCIYGSYFIQRFPHDSSSDYHGKVMRSNLMSKKVTLYHIPHHHLTQDLSTQVLWNGRKMNSEGGRIRQNEGEEWRMRCGNMCSAYEWNESINNCYILWNFTLIRMIVVLTLQQKKEIVGKAKTMQ